MTNEKSLVSTIAWRHGNSITVNTAIVLSGAILLSALAHISVPLPFTPVPITGQTFGVALISLLWGRKRAFTTVLLYMGFGISGLRVFALGQSGLTFGPTFGYLIGMMVASYAMGSLADSIKMNSFFKTLSAAYVGSVITFACGLIFLSFFVPAETLFIAGLWPFLLGDLIKNILVAGLITQLYRESV